VRDTTALGLHLQASSSTTLTVYSDADWTGCPDTRYSTLGYCVFFDESLVSWSSKRQPMVSHSIAEAKYRAVANTAAECIWLWQLLGALHRLINTTMVVFCDNVSVVYTTSNPVHHRRTKHIELVIHFIPERVALGELHVRHVPSAQQFTDVMTKGLSSSTFKDIRSSLCVGNPPTHRGGGGSDHASTSRHWLVTGSYATASRLCPAPLTCSCPTPQLHPRTATASARSCATRLHRRALPHSSDQSVIHVLYILLRSI
jgi:hypothetical protein